MKERAYKQAGVQRFLQNFSECGIKVGVCGLLGIGSNCFRTRLLAVRLRCCSNPGERVTSFTMRGIVSGYCDCLYYFSTNFRYVSMNYTRSNFSVLESPWIILPPLCLHSHAFFAPFSAFFPPRLFPSGFSSLTVIISYLLFSTYEDLLINLPSQDCSSIPIILTRLSLTLRISADHLSPFSSKLFKF